jgi:hypothetical protein
MSALRCWSLAASPAFLVHAVAREQAAGFTEIRRELSAPVASSAVPMLVEPLEQLEQDVGLSSYCGRMPTCSLIHWFLLWIGLGIGGSYSCRRCRSQARARLCCHRRGILPIGKVSDPVIALLAIAGPVLTWSPID